MNQPTDDEQLLAELRAALSDQDPVPGTVTAAARAAYAWRSIDAELAALCYDSLLDDKDLAGVRSAGDAARMLSFEADALSVEISIEGARIIGQLDPPQAGEIEVRHRGGLILVPADELGRFACDSIQHGPVSLRCLTSSATPVVTDWIVL
ncbi:MAG: hypothetical protein ABI912_05845 [Actinomycetota bacterium]